MKRNTDKKEQFLKEGKNVKQMYNLDTKNCFEQLPKLRQFQKNLINKLMSDKTSTLFI